MTVFGWVRLRASVSQLLRWLYLMIGWTDETRRRMNKTRVCGKNKMGLRAATCDIVDHERTGCATIIRACYGTKSLLTSRVPWQIDDEIGRNPNSKSLSISRQYMQYKPYLQFDLLRWHFDYSSTMTNIYGLYTCEHHHVWQVNLTWYQIPRQSYADNQPWTSFRWTDGANTTCQRPCRQ